MEKVSVGLRTRCFKEASLDQTTWLFKNSEDLALWMLEKKEFFTWRPLRKLGLTMTTAGFSRAQRLTMCSWTSKTQLSLDLTSQAVLLTSKLFPTLLRQVTRSKVANTCTNGKVISAKMPTWGNFCSSLSMQTRWIELFRRFTSLTRIQASTTPWTPWWITFGMASTLASCAYLVSLLWWPRTRTTLSQPRAPSQVVCVILLTQKKVAWLFLSPTSMRVLMLSKLTVPRSSLPSGTKRRAPLRI